MLGVQLSSPSFQGDANRVRPENRNVKDKSTEMQIGGGAGLATFGTLRNSSKIGNSLVRSIKSSTRIKAQKQAQLLELIGKFKPLAKFANNTAVKKVAGGLAGLSAVTGLVGSAAKIADTTTFLTAQNPEL